MGIEMYLFGCGDEAMLAAEPLAKKGLILSA